MTVREARSMTGCCLERLLVRGQGRCVAEELAVPVRGVATNTDVRVIPRACGTHAPLRVRAVVQPKPLVSGARGSYR
jgi:hypothetical protein